MNFGKIGIRNGYVFETLMARPRPKSGQVPPRGANADVMSCNEGKLHATSKDSACKTLLPISI